MKKLEEYLIRRIDSNKNIADLLEYPSYVEIETVNACNARCPMCTINDWNRNYPVMKDNVFNKINYRDLDQLILELEELRKNKATLFVIGNGGGAANATTMANDLGFDILKKTKTKNTFKVVSSSLHLTNMCLHLLDNISSSIT